MARYLSLHEADKIAEESAAPAHPGLYEVVKGMILNPAETLRDAFAHPLQRYALMLAAIGGIYWTLNLAIAEAGGSLPLSRLLGAIAEAGGPALPLSQMVAAIVVIGLCAGVAFLYAITILINWSCDILGGEPNRRKVRIMLAYAGVPGIIALVLFGIPKLAIFGQGLFSPDRGWLSSSPALAWGLLIGEAVLFAWSAVLAIKAIKIMNGFTTARAIAAATLPLGPILLIGLLFLSIAWSGLLLAPPAF